MPKKSSTILPPDRYLPAVTDLYEVTMAAAYFENRMEQTATFELWVRNLPPHRSYLIASGLEDALKYLSNLSFPADVVRYLKTLDNFKHVSPDFFKYLRNLKFTGDVWAIPEGTVVFAGEPLIRVTAPIIQAQIVETTVMSIVNYQTTVATKASRIVQAASHGGVERPVTDFGLRRAHGPGAGCSAARASFVGGCARTSNVYAGFRYAIPVHGTAAHSWIMAFDTELESFQKYYELFPESTILLIDTYDVKKGALNAARVGKNLRGVRIDSGDLVAQSKMVRKILDAAGLKDARIVASGDLNEYKIRDMLSAGAPIDIFGVGTEMIVSRDEPALQCVYKLVEEKKTGRTIYKAKFSEDKATFPGAKQVRRTCGRDGEFSGDVICLHNEKIKGEPLLAQVLKAGKITRNLPALREIQQRTKEQLSRLPAQYKRFQGADIYPVSYSDRLKELLGKVRRQYVRALAPNSVLRKATPTPWRERGSPQARESRTKTAYRTSNSVSPRPRPRSRQ
jgi:nicotinate phosphoribosyltransferase